MTEIEILDRQEQTGNREFYLMLIGRFYHAYGCGAFALARVTGYHVRRIQRKQGEVCVLGFPIDSFDSVRDKVRDGGGEMESIDGKTWRFSGLDGTPDLSIVLEPKPKSAEGRLSLASETVSTATAPAACGWLENEVRNFDLSIATPVDAMIFVCSLKKRLLADNNEQKR